ncbi:MAG: ABC transporter ATP-binding protein [Candidatus Saccharibacteria bacterium]|nr:ABC transporter ATP-binding protein [Candidatus Saccharibacteria bacterium]
MSSSFIEITNVGREYLIGEQKYKALDKISLTIKRGELVVILGPSGAGKSTLLNILGGMDSPTSGKVEVDGREISKYSSKQLTKYRAEKVGFIFQFYNIMPTLTAEENVKIIEDVSTTEKDASEVLKSVGLGRHVKKFPNELSGGEQQRVSIARAIMKDPALLLCDEPTGALDSKTGIEILKLLRKQADENTTVIIVTHNAQIAEIADRVIHLKNGEVEQEITNKKPKTVDEVRW